jgi:FkbM family methyltransferase
MSLKNLFRPLRKKFTQISGFDIVRLPHHQGIDFNILQIIKKQGVDTIIDVGANEGQFALRMRQIGFDGIIHSFEPVKATYTVLKEKAAKDPCWKTYDFALGKVRTRATINVSNWSDLSSFLPSNEFGRDHINGWRASRTEQVEVRTFDEFLREAQIESNRIFLKMDTQGFDLEVFAGALGSLDHIVGLLSEVSLIPIYLGMPDYLTALNEYTNRGFRVSGFYPVKKRDDLAMIEADCVMVKESAHAAS